MSRTPLARVLFAVATLVLLGCGDGEKAGDAAPGDASGSNSGTDGPQFQGDAGPGPDLGIPLDGAQTADVPPGIDGMPLVDAPRAEDGAPAADAPLLSDGPAVLDGSLAGVDAPLAIDAETVDLPPLDTAGCSALPKRFDADTVLPKGCYLADASPILAASVRLTLSPGVTILFAQDTGLALSGNQVLIAAGTAAEPILLTGAQPVRGFWRGVTLDGTLLPDSVLDHVIVEYAGRTASDKDAAAVKLTADSRGVRASITHTTLRESQGWGLWLGGSAVLGGFANNSLTRNTLGPASVSSEVVKVLDAASTYRGNDRDQLVVQTQYISTASTWAALDVPYYLAGGLSTSVDWTISPGATLIMAAGAKLNISGDTGALIANGTAEQPILFTAATASRGAWTGLLFDNSNNTRSSLTYVTVEYAGSTASDRDSAAIKMIADSSGVQVKIANTTIRQSQGWGLYLASSAVLPQFTGNRLISNQLGPVKAGSEVVHQLLPTSSYTGNDVDQIAVFANTVGAVTWSALDVPYVLDGGLEPTAVWTLAPGVTLLMAPKASITVSGDTPAISALGTAAAPILISGTVKRPGSWESILIDNSRNSANAFDHCTIEYGGGGQLKGEFGMIIAQSDSRGVKLAVTNSVVQQSSQYGIVLSRYAQATISGNTYAGNGLGDVYQLP
jgi:hypothetical protein